MEMAKKAKYWKKGKDMATWTPTAVCPYCDTTFNAVVVIWFSRCPLCLHDVRLPDNWDSLEEGEKDE